MLISISKIKATHYPDFGLEELVPSLWIESEWEYDISAFYGISHWWFKPKSGIESYSNKAQLTRPRCDESDLYVQQKIHHRSSEGDDKERRHALSISKMKATHYPDFRLEELVPSLWIESEWEYDISAFYGISHWWFKRKEFYIARHSAPFDRRAVRSHMRILSSKSENKEMRLTEMELVLEQTQQGTSHEVSISSKGVEE
ncbi:hypothetical protein Tco_1120517 [Tanacetum coccineum]